MSRQDQANNRQKIRVYQAITGKIDVLRAKFFGPSQDQGVAGRDGWRRTDDV